MLNADPVSQSSPTFESESHPRMTIISTDKELVYRRICILICPQCKFLEFPGCGDDKQLLSLPFGPMDEMACNQCMVSNSMRSYHHASHITSTHISLPWAEACRNCKKVKATRLNVLLSEPDFSELLKPFKGPTDKIDSPISVCKECRVCHFHPVPTTHEPNSIQANFTQACTQPCAHAFHDCTGTYEVQTVSLSHSEISFCQDFYKTTPIFRGLLSQLTVNCPSNNNSAPENEQKSNDRHKAIHPGIACHSCHKNPIQGIRFKCMICNNLNFCELCEEKLKAPAAEPCESHVTASRQQMQACVTHALIKYTKPRQIDYQIISPSDTGYSRSLFVAPANILDALVCAICLEICRCAKLTDCGHVFCESCLKKCTTLRFQCPMDRIPIAESIFMRSDVFERQLRNYIEQQVVRCSRQSFGCTWNGTLSSLQSHLTLDCAWQDCEFEKYGCQVKVQKLIDTTTNSNPDPEQHKHQHTELLLAHLNQMYELQGQLSDTFRESLKIINHPSICREYLDASLSFVAHELLDLRADLKEKSEAVESDIQELTTNQEVSSTNNIFLRAQNVQILQDQKQIVEKQQRQQRHIFVLSFAMGVLGTCVVGVGLAKLFSRRTMSPK